MDSNDRLARYRSIAGMLQVLPCTEHARLFITACQEDLERYNQQPTESHFDEDSQAEQIIMEICESNQPCLHEDPASWVLKASRTLSLIREHPHE